MNSQENLSTAIPPVGSLEAKPSATRWIGLAFPFCEVKTEPNLHPSSCKGYRIDYVSQWYIILAFKNITVKFADPFVDKLEYLDFALGLRIEPAPLIARLLKTEVNPYFAPLYFAYFPYFLTLYPPTVFTSSYQYMDRRSVNDSFELGWKFGQSWDIFINTTSSRLRPFTIKRSDHLEQGKIAINVIFLGVHYGF